MQSRYGAILEREGVDLSSEMEVTEPIEWWLQATTNGADKPKINQIIGFPGVPANTLLPNLAHRFREGTRGGASSSSSAPNRPPNMPDQLFVQVVRNVIAAAQTDPVIFSDNWTMQSWKVSLGILSMLLIQIVEAT